MRASIQKLAKLLRAGIMRACTIFKWVVAQAIIKAMLNSPTADQGGFCNLFTLVEPKQLAHREPKLMEKIKEANKSITMVDSFLRAY